MIRCYKGVVKIPVQIEPGLADKILGFPIQRLIYELYANMDKIFFAYNLKYSEHLIKYETTTKLLK